MAFAAQDLASVNAVQASGGAVQSQGAQLVPAAQAGQVQTVDEPVAARVVGPPLAAPVPAVAAPLAFPAPVLPMPTVMVVVDPPPQLQLQGAHAAPAGQVGQAQVQVPPPFALPAPVVVPQTPPPPLPPAPPLPVEPPPPPAPLSQSHAQGAQVSPGAQGRQAQVQVPPPAFDPPPSWMEGGGQSQDTGGQAPSLGHARGCTQPQPLPAGGACQQYPPDVQSCPTGHSAGAEAVPASVVQAHRASAPQAWVSTCVAQGSTVAHTAAGQSAPAGQATAVQAQAAPAPLQVSAVVKLPQGSATRAAAS